MSDSQYVYLIKFDSNGNQILPGLTQHAKQAHNAFDQLKERTESLNGVLAKFGVGYLGWEMVGKLKEIGHEAVMTEAKFSRIAVVLSNALGSKSEAQKNLDMIREFAATTPYQVDALSESFLRLANRGVVMKEPQMRGVGDLAASLGKDFGQVIDAVLLHSNSRVWRTIGIKSKLEEGKLRLTFRGITQTVEDTEAGALKAVTALGMLKGVAGATEAIMGTTGGKLSNLKDKADEFYKALGEKIKPLTDDFIGTKGKFYDTMTKWLEEKPQDKLEKEIQNIRILQTQITSLGKTEEQRKSLLEQLKNVNEETVKGIDAQSISYSKLNENIENVITSTSKKILLEKNKEKFGEIATKKQELNIEESQGYLVAAELIAKFRPDIAKDNKLSMIDKAHAVWNYLNREKKNKGDSYLASTQDAQTWGSFPIAHNNPNEKGLTNNDIYARDILYKFLLRHPDIVKEKTELSKQESNLNNILLIMKTALGITDNSPESNNKNKIPGSEDPAENIMKGGSSQKIINITVHKFQDKIEQHISSEPGDAKRKAEEVTDLMNEHLMRILNSANQMAN